ncbi:conserved unknown protein [Ectocarpus siliculosus]|uniref:Exportin-4 n=1 Tax=Ectocarpus siliculosus TaxID=2880 RepID=D7FX52_ECTSI|nr:conserved unknown protein [Ectocarpus siliculosus]|eukprot:CBJ26385.1 conserved unknown protein [Ectocarpus siliculosus]
MLPNFSSPEEAVVWMESLCRAFPTNPKEAEVALTELHRSDHAAEVSKIILERSQMPMAQFHALLALQEAVLARWDSVPPADRRALKGYLWEFLCREWARLERSVVSQALRTFCVFWRRGWSAETEEAKLSLFALLQQGASEGGAAALRSAKALFSLVSEFSSTRATALGLPLEFFRATHAAFNKLGLDQSLALSMELLGETVKAVATPEALSDTSVLELVTTVVNVCAEVLSWEFKYVEAWQIPPAQQLIRPGPRWRAYLVRPDFLGAVFNVYHRVRLRGTAGPGGTLPHALRQLLLQLSSVHGDIFENDDQRKAYASFLVEGAAAVLAAPFSSAGVRQEGVHQGAAEAAAEEAQADEYIGIASMAVRLVSNFKLSTLGQLDSFAAFAQHLAALSSRMLHESKALAGRDDDEDVGWRRETFALLLEAWVAMAEDFEVTGGENQGMRKGMQDATFPLYEQYLEHELTVSRVEAEASVGHEEDDEEEEIGAADKDEQMCSAACLGRLSLARALAAVDVQVRGVSEVLSRLLETGAVNGQPGLLPGGQELSPAATGVMEQARTAVVLAAHLIADKDDSMVPERLHAVLLVDDHAAELLVSLVHSLLNLLELHVTLLERGAQQQQQGAGGGGGCSSSSPLLSPYLGGALLWCLTRWASGYLFADLSLYEGGFSYRLTQAFGSSGPEPALSNPPGSAAPAAAAPLAGGAGAGTGGADVAGALLRASWMCLCAWPSQPDVCVNALDLMGVLVSRTKAPSTTSLPLWWEIVAAYDGGRQAAGAGAAGAGAGGAGRDQGFRRLSVDLQGLLVQRLCEGVLNRSALPSEGASAKEGFEKVVGPVWERFRGLLHAVGGLSGVRGLTKNTFFGVIGVQDFWNCV